MTTTDYFVWYLARCPYLKHRSAVPVANLILSERAPTQ